MTETIDWRAKQPSQGVCVSEDLKCWGPCDTIWAQSQGHHIIDCLEAWGVKRGSARRSFLKGRDRANVSQMNTGTVVKATLGKTSERRGGRHNFLWAFPRAQIPSGTELNLFFFSNVAFKRFSIVLWRRPCLSVSSLKKSSLFFFFFCCSFLLLSFSFLFVILPEGRSSSASSFCASQALPPTDTYNCNYGMTFLCVVPAGRVPSSSTL